MSQYVSDDDFADELRKENEALRAQLAEAKAEAQFAAARAPRPIDESALNAAMHAAKSFEELHAVLEDAGMIDQD